MDVQHSPGKSWKAFQADYDFVFAQSDRLCNVCLSQQQIQALLSQTEYLYWPSRWVKVEGDVDENIVTQFTEDLERQLLMACCDDNLPIQWRYSPGGVLQQSTNGGGQWVDAPLYDPRVYSPQFPPMAGADGDDKKCIAATGGAALLKEQVGDQLADGMSRYTLTQLITDWVGTMIETSNPFQALLTVISNQIFALVIATLRPALTDTVYETFKCILFCRMNSRAIFSDAAWASVRSDITDQIGGIAGIFLEHLVYLLGKGGLTNLVRAGGAATGDCSGCDTCPSNCDPSGWTTGYYYTPDGHWTYRGTIEETGDNYIIVRTQDRGDGQQVLVMTVTDFTTCCGLLVEPIGEASAHTLISVANCGTDAHYENWVRNDLLPNPFEAEGFQFQLDPHTGGWLYKITWL